MITEYYRPDDIPTALDLLKEPDTLPLGGGTLLSQLKMVSVKVVDLQNLGLNTVSSRGKTLEIGGTATLGQLHSYPKAPAALKVAIKHETPLNIRNIGTVAGTLVAADGRSTFATALLALDAKLTLDGQGPAVESLGEFLPLRPGNLKGRLITRIAIPFNAELAFETVGRTPADKPILCAALARWPSGRTRLSLGGYGRTPLLAMDGTEADGLEEAARNACHEAADEWASAEYRMHLASTLAGRCLKSLTGEA